MIPMPQEFQGPSLEVAHFIALPSLARIWSRLQGELENPQEEEEMGFMIR